MGIEVGVIAEYNVPAPNGAPSLCNGRGGQASLFGKLRHRDAGILLEDLKNAESILSSSFPFGLPCIYY